LAVYKQPNSPSYLIEFVYQGHRYRKSSETASKAKAQDIERAWRVELKDSHHLGKLPSHSWGEAIVKYNETVIIPKGNTVSAKTHQFTFETIGKAFGENTPLEKITSRVIAQYKDEMISSGRAMATVNKHLAFIKAILRRCVRDWHWLREVPQIQLEKLKNDSLAWITKEQEEKLLPHLPGWLKELVIFLVDTGARLSEATGLEWKNLELDRQPRAIVKFLETKNNEPRGVPLTKRCEAMLREIQKRNKGLDVVPGDGEIVLLKEDPKNTKHGTETKDKYRRIAQPFKTWKDALKKARLSQSLRLHDLRHTFASRLVMARVPILDVSKLLGHKSLKMTLRYAHLAPDTLGSAIAVLDG
jgi:integrase